MFNTIKRAFGKRIHTVYGPILSYEYDIELGCPCVKLLELTCSYSKTIIELKRLNNKERFDKNMEREVSRLKEIIKDIMPVDYGYVLGNFPIPDIIVPNLVLWGIQLYGSRVTLAPRESVIMSIAKTA